MGRFDGSILRMHVSPLCPDHRSNAKRRNGTEGMGEASGELPSVTRCDGCAEFHAKDGEEFETFVRTSSASDHFAGCGKRFADMA